MRAASEFGDLTLSGPGPGSVSLQCQLVFNVLIHFRPICQVPSQHAAPSPVVPGARPCGERPPVWTGDRVSAAPRARRTSLVSCVFRLSLAAFSEGIDSPAVFLAILQLFQVQVLVATYCVSRAGDLSVSPTVPSAGPVASRLPHPPRAHRALPDPPPPPLPTQ